MKVLGIESSSLVASAAVLDGGVIKSEYTACNGLTHSQTLLPMIDEAVRMSGVSPDELDAIAISAGPGSFTGLRIGAATAKGLGLALDKPLIAVPTLAATAYNLFGTNKLICPIMDARRNQVYNGLYSFVRTGDAAGKGTSESQDNGYELCTLVDSRALGIDELLDELKEAKTEVIFLGDGVPVFREVIERELGEAATFAPAQHSRQRAACVAQLGAEMYARGELVSSDDFAPVYLRKSQAERELENNRV